MCEDGSTFTGYEKVVGTGQSGVETSDWGEPSNPSKRGNKDAKLEMMMNYISLFFFSYCFSYTVLMMLLSALK